MYKAFCDVCERLLRIPPPPEPPPGDEHTTKVFRAAPNYFKYLLVVWVIKTAFLVFVLGVGLAGVIVATVMSSRHGNIGALIVLVFELLILGAVVLSRLISLAIVRLDYEKRWYVVTDRSLRVRQGILNVQEMTVNFANIQNISISQGPIQRWLQIADLKVDTAGGGSMQTQGQHQMRNLHTAFFRGVDNALEIRELIQSRLRPLKDSGLGDHEELSASHPEAQPEIISVLREIHEETQKLNVALSTV